MSRECLDVDPFVVRCRFCHAIPGTQCISSVTGQVLRKAAAHPTRIHDALLKAQSEESDDG